MKHPEGWFPTCSQKSVVTISRVVHKQKARLCHWTVLKISAMQLMKDPKVSVQAPMCKPERLSRFLTRWNSRAIFGLSFFVRICRQNGSQSAETMAFPPQKYLGESLSYKDSRIPILGIPHRRPPKAVPLCFVKVSPATQLDTWDRWWCEGPNMILWWFLWQ